MNDDAPHVQKVRETIREKLPDQTVKAKVWHQKQTDEVKKRWIWINEHESLACVEHLPEGKMTGDYT